MVRQSSGPETRILMRPDGVIHSHQAVKRELWLTRIVVAAFTLICTAVSVLLFIQHLPGCKFVAHVDTASEKHALVEARVDTRSDQRAERAERPALLKVDCDHSSVSQEGPITWEQNNDNNYKLSNDSVSLIIPSNGLYRVALQVTYRGTDQVSLDKQTILQHHLYLFSDSYQSDRMILSVFETIYYEDTMWRKSLYSEGIFSLEEGDRLKVKTSSLRLVDCDGNVGIKTFFTVHPHGLALVGGA